MVRSFKTPRLQAEPPPTDGASIPGRDTIVIGASAGGYKALAALVKRIPADLPAAIFVVLHFPVAEASSLLTKFGPIPVRWATDREPIQLRRMYIAPPDRHLILKPSQMRLIHAARENRFRPAVDPLFRSAAIAYGPRVIGIILSGLLDDGAAGMIAIKKCGGTAIVQDPHQAPFPDMPRSAMKHAPIDYTLPVEEIGPLLAQLVKQPIDQLLIQPAPRDVLVEQAMLEQAMPGMEGNMELGEPSVFSCPDCNGVLWQIRSGDLLRFRCHVGHSYTADSMLHEHSESVENSLWAALRALEERRKLCQTMAENSRAQGLDRAAQGLLERANEAKKHGDALRTILIKGREFSKEPEPSVQSHLAAGNGDPGVGSLTP